MALLDRLEAGLRGQFGLFVRDMKSDAVLKVVEDLLAQGDIESALGLLDAHIKRLAAAIPDAFTTAATEETAALAPQVAAIIPEVAVSFDPTNPVAADLMAQSKLEFIREFTDEQRQVVRQAIGDAFARGGGFKDAAGAFRDSIGLTQRQLAAVNNYRDLLERGSAEALNRQLRDRRFDPTVERSVRGGKPPTPAQIDNMVERYRQRALASRAETIARTEGVRIASEARREAFRQTMEDAGITDDMVERTWRAVGDTRTRDTHRALSGTKVVGMDATYRSPSGATLRYPGDPQAPAAEVINCRCVETYRIKTRAELDLAA